MLLTTGFDFQGYEIKKYCGLVFGESALGTGFLSSLNAGISDLLGKDSDAYVDKLTQAKDISIQRMVRCAEKVIANAIIGVEVNYTVFSADIIGVIASGTAVHIEKIEKDKEEEGNYKILDFSHSNIIDILHPCRLYLNEDSIEVEFLVDGGSVLNGVIADIHLKTIFEKEIVFRDLEFVDFSLVRNRFYRAFHRIKDAPYNIVKKVNNACIIVKEYILDNSITEIDTSNIELIDLKNTNAHEFEMEKEQIISRLNELRSAKKIYDYVILLGGKYKDYFDDKLIEKLEGYVKMERMFGNCQADAQKSVMEYLNGKS